MPLLDSIASPAVTMRKNATQRPRWQAVTREDFAHTNALTKGNASLVYEPHFNPVKNLKPMDKALSKTLKFRAVTLVTTLSIAWLLTGNPVTTIGLTAIQQSTNTAVYYFFEKNDKKKAQEQLGN